MEKEKDAQTEKEAREKKGKVQVETRINILKLYRDLSFSCKR
jgi:hypothetical protein